MQHVRGPSPLPMFVTAQPHPHPQLQVQQAVRMVAAAGAPQAQMQQQPGMQTLYVDIENEDAKIVTTYIFLVLMKSERPVVVLRNRQRALSLLDTLQEAFGHSAAQLHQPNLDPNIPCVLSFESQIKHLKHEIPGYPSLVVFDMPQDGGTYAELLALSNVRRSICFLVAGPQEQQLNENRVLDELEVSFKINFSEYPERAPPKEALLDMARKAGLIDPVHGAQYDKPAANPAVTTKPPPKKAVADSWDSDADYEKKVLEKKVQRLEQQCEQQQQLIEQLRRELKNAQETSNRQGPRSGPEQAKGSVLPGRHEQDRWNVREQVQAPMAGRGAGRAAPRREVPDWGDSLTRSGHDDRWSSEPSGGRTAGRGGRGVGFGDAGAAGARTVFTGLAPEGKGQAFGFAQEARAFVDGTRGGYGRAEQVGRGSEGGRGRAQRAGGADLGRGRGRRSNEEREQIHNRNDDGWTDSWEASPTPFQPDNGPHNDNHTEDENDLPVSQEAIQRLTDSEPHFSTHEMQQQRESPAEYDAPSATPTEPTPDAGEGAAPFGDDGEQ